MQGCRKQRGLNSKGRERERERERERLNKNTIPKNEWPKIHHQKCMKIKIKNTEPKIHDQKSIPKMNEHNTDMPKSVGSGGKEMERERMREVK